MTVEPLWSHMLACCYRFVVLFSVCSLGLCTLGLPGEPCNTCTDGHIRGPFLDDVHALRLWAVALLKPLFLDVLV